jgi:hypothetical protein
MMTGIIEGSLTQTLALTAKGRKGEHQSFKAPYIVVNPRFDNRLAPDCGAMWPSLDFERKPTRADHMIGRTIDGFATRTREIASGRGVGFILMSAM